MQWCNRYSEPQIIIIRTHTNNLASAALVIESRPRMIRLSLQAVSRSHRDGIGIRVALIKAKVGFQSGALFLS